MLKNELRLLLSGKIISNLEQFSSLEEIYQSSKLKYNSTKEFDRKLKYIEENNVFITDYFSQDYPESLKNMENPPLVLFMLGKFRNTSLPLAVVGTRNPSGYGEKAVKYLLPYLVKSGFSIISGMAKGIDALAHKETLKEGGYTIAVLGSGIDIVYPEENRKLYKEIVEKGCIISEFAPGTMPMKHHFPLRNRIIAGLSKGTLVVEADIKSGSLITARLTEELSKPIFALPGEIFAKRSKGTNKLISQGAFIVNDIESILSYFYIELRKEIEAEKSENTFKLSKDERKIMDIMEGDMSIDELILKTGMSISKLNDILFDLEIKSLIRHTPSDMYEKL